MVQMAFKHGCILVLGGAKSGKSSYALDTCNRSGKKRVFLATAQAGDLEMEERIRKHRAERGPAWSTREEPIEITEIIRREDGKDTIILVDCLTLWLSNLFMKYKDDNDAIERVVESFVGQLANIRGSVVAVSNEVGTGIVPDNALSRRYRDRAGMLNQQVAAVSRKVVAVFAGIPLVLKEESFD
jgi:adenosylcobinamide kinase/adenosylcobinamide-phosphate guanylyltransferase